MKMCCDGLAGNPREENHHEKTRSIGRWRVHALLVRSGGAVSKRRTLLLPAPGLSSDLREVGS